MDRGEAFELVKSKISNRNLVKHCLAVEAVMRGLAAHLGEDQDYWGLAGLLHDLDYEETGEDAENHTLVTERILRERNVDEAIIHTIKCHCDKAPRENLMDKAIYATDPVTGLIVAAALMHPSKKLKEVDVPFLLRRFKEKRFAAGANREQIRTCGDLGLSLEEFLRISLEAMQGIDKELGL
ncbi:MAG: HDIG domain-containing metalloprotein [bacterium]